MSKLQKLFPHPLFRLDNAHRMRTQRIDRFFERLDVFNVVGDDFIAKRSVVLIVLQQIARDVLVAGIDNNVFCSDQFSRTHDKHIYCRDDTVCFKSKNVEIEVFGQCADLFSYKFVKQSELVSIIERNFKVFLGGKLFHFFGKSPLDFLVVAPQKVNDILHFCFIFLFANLMSARRKASSQMHVQTRSGRL